MQSPCLSNKLPASFHQPNPDHSFSHSSEPNCPIITTVIVHHSYSSTLNSKDNFSLNPSTPHPFHRTAFTDTRLLSGLFLVFLLTF